MHTSTNRSFCQNLDQVTGHKSGVNRKQSPGQEVEVVWACDEKRGTLGRREGDGNENSRENEERKA